MDDVDVDQTPRQSDSSADERHLDSALTAAFQPRFVERPRTDSIEDAATTSRRGRDKDDERDVKCTQVVTDSDRYTVLGELGRGGMGIVLHVRDQDFGRDLAVKVLRQRFRGRRSMERRFVTEAQICGQLQHPGIVPVHDVGWQQDQRPFFTMKLVRGSTLADVLAEREDPSTDLARCIAAFHQVCQAMSYAHSRGVVHRDLKPDNIMVGTFGEVQIMDWGAARIVPTSGTAGLTDEPPVETVLPDFPAPVSEAGSIIGTWAYMPPEQARGLFDLADRRSDVFSLGAILCEILTGSPPYVFSSQDELRAAAASGRLGEAFDRLAACGADDDLICLARRSLDPQPTSRPADACVLAREVSDYMASVARRLRETELARAAAEARAQAENRARRLTLALASTVLSASLLAGGTYLYLEDQHWQRVVDTRRTVDEAIRIARRHEADARASNANVLTSWNEAIAVLKQAAAAIGSGESDAETRSLVHGLLAEFDRERTSAAARLRQQQRNRQILTALRRVQQTTQRDSEYASAFREYGIDVDALAMDAVVQALRNCPIGGELTPFLDPWARARRRARTDKSRDWTRLIEIALLVDDDEQRSVLRRAVRDRDGPALVALARSPAARQLPATTLHLLGAELTAVREHRTAVDLLTGAWQRFPRDFHICSILAQNLEQLEPPRWDAAVRYRSAALAVEPGLLPARVDLSLALQKSGAVEEASACLDVAASPSERCAWHSRLAARLGGDLEEFDGALRASEEAIRADPESGAAWYNKGTILFKLGEFEAAVAAFERSIELRFSAHAHDNLGACLVKLGRDDEAVRAYRAGIAANPHDYLLHFNLGALLVKRKRLDEAILHLEESRKLNPLHGATHERIGLAFELQGKWDPAVQSYREAIRLGEPQRAEFLANCHNAIGVDHFNKHDFDRAVERFHEAIKCDPGMGMPRCNLGNALREMGRLDAALAAYREAIVRDPRYAPSYRALGSLLLRSWDVAAAIEQHRTALRLEPNNVLALNDLAWALIIDRQYDEATTILRRAVSLDPDYFTARANLSYVLQETGQFAEALEVNRVLLARHAAEANRRTAAERYLTETERLIELEAELHRYLRGNPPPTEVATAIELAKVAARKRRWSAAARLWTATAPRDPSGIRAAVARNPDDIFGVRVLTMAGSGSGIDPESSDPETRTRWRGLALTWSRAIIAHWTEVAKTGGVRDRDQVAQTMKRWQHEPELRNTRAASTLMQLPASERKGWVELWASVNSLCGKDPGK